jgi:hypothetical protein
MAIEKKVDPEKDLTIFIAEGNPSFEEYMAAVKLFYDGETTRNVLWQIDQETVWNISGHHIKKLAQFAPRVEKSRPGAKTAFVAPDELSESLSNLFVLFGQSHDLKIKIKIFKSTDEAVEWIKAG